MELDVAKKLWQPEPGWLNTAKLRPAARPGLGGTAGGPGRLAGGADLVGGVGRVRRTVPGRVRRPGRGGGGGRGDRQHRVAAARSGGGRPPPGATVVVPEVEFTSNLFPWLVQQERGVKVRTVPLVGLVDAIDAGTDRSRSVWCSRPTVGRPVHGIVAAAGRTARSSRWTPPRPAAGCPSTLGLADVVAVAAYKWLMAPRRAAFAYLAPALPKGCVPAPPAGTRAATRTPPTTVRRCGWPTTPGASTSPRLDLLRGRGTRAGAARRDRAAGGPGPRPRPCQPVPRRPRPAAGAHSAAS